MSVVLLAGLLASVVTVITVVVFCLRREFRRASKVAFRWGICAATYAAILVATAMIPHESALKTGAPYCDDDMCMSVESVSRCRSRPVVLTALECGSLPGRTTDTKR